MAHYLPPAVMAFFQPRQPLKILPAVKPVHKRGIPFTGLAAYTSRFNSTPEQEEAEAAASAAAVAAMPLKETPLLRRTRVKEEKAAAAAAVIEEQRAAYDASAREAPEVTANAMKTLCVGRLAYDITDEDLKTEFEYYGDVIEAKVVKDKEGKSRGYGFIEFESSKSLKDAFKTGDGKKIRGRRIVVDVERGRTVKGWFPRRLAGGMGRTRVGERRLNDMRAGREQAPHDPSDRDDRGRDRGDDRGRGGDRGGGGDRGYGGDRRDDRRGGGGGYGGDRRGGGGDRGGYDRGGGGGGGGGGGYGGGRRSGGYGDDRGDNKRARNY
jgi:U1 small nuclear ribonucleoprotein